PLAVGYFVSRDAERAGRTLSAANISPEAWEIIEGYSWPGNVRELENVVNRAFTLMEGDRIKAEDLGIQLMGVRRKGDTFRGEADLQLADIRPGFDLEKRLEEIEISYIKRALEMTDGVLVEAAKLLGLTFRALRYKVRKYGIKR
ncbi:MAG: sigma-54-dependent Fis family transcriptional regulator, partial [Planctomycetota bacterium]